MKFKKTLFTVLMLAVIKIAGSAQTYPEMISVNGGSFMMGDGLPQGNEGVQAQHRVTLDTFKISKTEVTVKQYRAFCEDVGRNMPAEPRWGWQDNFPIVNVTWQDAVDYCYWLSLKFNDLYRLPTEAEWEYAAKGGDKGKGFEFSGSQTLENVGWFEYNSDGQPHAAAVKTPNELGIYDMSGNVWEWCIDWYDSEYYTNSPAKNPTGTKNGFNRVMRGGGWDDDASFCRVAYRSFSSPDEYYNFTGFRVVLAQKSFLE